MARTFANLIDKDYPGHDYDDLMSAVDAAVATGFVDPDNLFVTGGSGGGVLTAWIVGKTDRFRAAATQKPVINYASFALTTDFAAGFSPSWRKERPWEDPHDLLEIFAAEPGRQRQDPDPGRGRRRRLPHARSARPSNIIPRSRSRGVPTALVKVPGAGHGITARPQPVGGQGQRDHRLVRPLQRTPAAQLTGRSSKPLRCSTVHG